MSVLVKLAARYVKNDFFVLTVLGKYYKENTREVKLGDSIYKVNTVKLCIIGAEDSRFNFKVKNNAGLFISDPHGEYTLPMTTSQHLLAEDTNEGMANYIRVACLDKQDGAVEHYVRIS